MSWSFYIDNIDIRPHNWNFSCQMFDSTNINIAISSMVFPFIGGAYRVSTRDENTHIIHSVVGDTTLKIGFDENDIKVVEYKGSKNPPGSGMFVYLVFELPPLSLNNLIEYFKHLPINGIQTNTLTQGYFNYQERHGVANLERVGKIPKNVAYHILSYVGGSRKKQKRIRSKNLTCKTQ